jgi:hypothetical protein
MRPQDTRCCGAFIARLGQTRIGQTRFGQTRLGPTTRASGSRRPRPRTGESPRKTSPGYVPETAAVQTARSRTGNAAGWRGDRRAPAQGTTTVFLSTFAATPDCARCIQYTTQVPSGSGRPERRRVTRGLAAILARLSMVWDSGSVWDFRFVGF